MNNQAIHNFIDSMKKILTLFSLDLRGIQYHHSGSKRADKEQLKKICKNTKIPSLLEFNMQRLHRKQVLS